MRVTLKRRDCFGIFTGRKRLMPVWDIYLNDRFVGYAGADGNLKLAITKPCTDEEIKMIETAIAETRSGRFVKAAVRPSAAMGKEPEPYSGPIIIPESYR